VLPLGRALSTGPLATAQGCARALCLNSDLLRG